MKKPKVWAERLGYTMTIRTAQCRITAVMRPGEMPKDTVRRMGFQLVGQFMTDQLVPNRATALVVAK